MSKRRRELTALAETGLTLRERHVKGALSGETSLLKEVGAVTHECRLKKRRQFEQ